MLLSPLYIKHGLMKQFVKTLDKEGKFIEYLSEKFARLSYEKLRAGIFNDPQIRRLEKDPTFMNSMKNEERSAWMSLAEVVSNFLKKQS